MRRRSLRAGAILFAGGMLAAACGSSQGSGSTSTTSGKSSGSPITIGFITSETGLAASSFVGSQWGAQARIDAQNAAGGVNGHKLELAVEDDQSSPSDNQTAAQLLVQKGAFGIVEDTSFTFGASKYLNQQGVPVTGAAIDGPEWGQEPNTNMFSVTGIGSTPINGKYYAYDTNARFLKAIGVTKLAGAVFAIQSAIQAMSSTFQTAAPLGISQCYVNNSIPFGAADFTAVVLAIKSAGCNGVVGVTLLSTDIALSGALKQGGLASAKQLYYTAYDQNLLNQPSALATMKGDYTTTAINYSDPSTGARTMLAQLKKYTPFHGTIPSLNISQGWAATDLMIKGLQLAGANPTRHAFISKLRQVSGYTASGLYPSPGVSFEHFGTVAQFPKSQCSYFMKIETSGFVPYNGGKLVCGKLVATNGASS